MGGIEVAHLYEGGRHGLLKDVLSIMLLFGVSDSVKLKRQSAHNSVGNKKYFVISQ